MTRFLLMTLFMGACCAATLDLDGLTPAQQEIVRDAVADYERWGCTFDGNLLPRTVRIRWADELAAGPNGEEVANWSTCAADDGMEDHIDFNSSYSWHLDGEPCVVDGNPVQNGPFDFRSVVLHELGHALGLKHVADKNAIMAPQIGACVHHDEPTAADLAEIRSHC